MKYCLFPNAVAILIMDPTNRSVAPIEPITIAMINKELPMRFSLTYKLAGWSEHREPRLNATSITSARASA